MQSTLSHSFTFKTKSSVDPTAHYQNILYLNEENASKYFIQYIQYHENSDSSIDLRHLSIKVDRPYFLEVANVCISDKERRRHFFSTLGKRRFGASNKHLDSYFSHRTVTQRDLFLAYMTHYEYTEFQAFHTEKTKYSTNKYRIYIQENDNLHIVFLDQLNITSRKKIHKIFCTDITSEELNFYTALETPTQKVNYIFNKIGKNHFKSLPQTNLKSNKHYKNNEALACSMLITNANAMEKSSQIQDNTSFRKLQNKIKEVGRIDITLAQAAQIFINKPDENTEKLFSLELNTFRTHIKEISGLKSIAQHLQEIHELTRTNTISYLLSKDDQDLYDIFLYILEAFKTWNNYLFNENAEIKSFNSASIDLADALRHFVDVSYQFKHDYKCTDVVEEIQEQTQEEQEIVTELPIETFTSAKSYFGEIDLDSEVYDELLELEREIEVLSYAAEYTGDITVALINFFEGYTRVLNPLFEFKDLSYSLMLLTQKLSEYEIDENSEMLLILMRGLISDLLEWKRTVLVEQTAEDIHFMDKSFYSNIAQIEISLENNYIEDDDGGMEFF